MAPARKGRLKNPRIEENSMTQYIPSPRDWVREQVELYERTNGAQGNTLRDTGLPVIIVTHIGNKTGAIRKTPLMRVKDGENYVLVGSMGGAPKNPVWVYNLRANPQVDLRDLSVVQTMRVREVTDTAERERLWKIAEAVYPRFAEYRNKTKAARVIPIFVAERVSER
jgi:F420H(2)-dependent quinone reductase